MLALKYQFNYAIRTLFHDTAEFIGVRMKSGEVHYVAWRGFIHKKQIPYLIGNPRPVKLVVDYYHVQSKNSRLFDWLRVAPNHYIQGCYLDDYQVVFAVLDKGVPRVV